MRFKQIKFKNVDLVPTNPLAITFHTNFKKTRIALKPKVSISVWSILAASALIILVYPFLPIVLYNINSPELPKAQPIALGEFNPNPQGVNFSQSGAPIISADYENKIIIPKIGVNINVSDTDDQDEALSKGAWHFPETSTPNEGGNSAFSAHRYQYLPPHSETFYLLDKLETGDTFIVVWDGKEYLYSVYETMIVSPYSVEVLNSTEKSTVTLITCNPLFSTKERLVVRGELIRVN